jgi:hypothetical protein
MQIVFAPTRIIVATKKGQINHENRIPIFCEQRSIATKWGKQSRQSEKRMLAKLDFLEVPQSMHCQDEPTIYGHDSEHDKASGYGPDCR